MNLSAALALADKRVLLVDVDPQANAGSGLGITVEEDAPSVYGVFLGEFAAHDVIRETEIDGLFVLPSAPSLTGAEVELVSLDRRETRLRSALQPELGKYDYLIVDTPPSLGLLTLNALVAAECVLITTQCEYYALEGMSNLTQTINLVRGSLNAKLSLLGVLLTMYDARLNLSQQVAAEARDVFGSSVFETMIPRNVRLSEAPSFGKPIMLYDAFSTGASAYIALAKEILEREQESAR